MSVQTSIPKISAATVDEFCHAHRISRGTFYNLLKTGHGPCIMKVGSRTLISAEAAVVWRRQMEHSASAAPNADPQLAKH
jgi:hypothetical protein